LRVLDGGGRPASIRNGGGEDARRLKMPSPPPEIFAIPEALAEWKRAGPILYALGLISELDRSVFTSYCIAYARHMAAVRAVTAAIVADSRRHKKNRTGGLMVRGSRKNVVQNPAVRIEREAGRDVLRFAEQLGLTPSARSKIKADTGPSAAAEPEDDLD
jgi:P27 family predicted phage terminase small subunit